MVVALDMLFVHVTSDNNLYLCVLVLKPLFSSSFWPTLIAQLDKWLIGQQGRILDSSREMRIAVISKIST